MVNEKESFGGEIAKNIPIQEIYTDVLHPPFSEVGKALQGAVRIGLSPISALVWGFDKIASYLEFAIPEYFAKRKVVESKIQTPDISIAVPIIEAMRYTSNKEEILQMFTNLLGASMNVDMAEFIHPAYVEIIKQLSPDEIRIFNLLPRKGLVEPIIDVSEERFGREGMYTYYSNVSVLGIEANCDIPENTSVYINNLCRLGICEIPNTFLVEGWRYDKILKSQFYEKIIEGAPKENKYSYIKKSFGITDFGDRLREVCT